MENELNAEQILLLIFLVVVIPIFVIGTVTTVIQHLRSKERQLLINKGVPTEHLVELFKSNRSTNPYLMLKIGVIIAFFGFSILIGNIFDYWFDFGDAIIVFMVFMFFGLGMVAASLIGKRLEERDEEKERKMNQETN